MLVARIVARKACLYEPAAEPTEPPPTGTTVPRPSLLEPAPSGDTRCGACAGDSTVEDSNVVSGRHLCADRCATSQLDSQQ